MERLRAGAVERLLLQEEGWRKPEQTRIAEMHLLADREQPSLHARDRGLVHHELLGNLRLTETARFTRDH